MFKFLMLTTAVALNFDIPSNVRITHLRRDSHITYYGKLAAPTLLEKGETNIVLTLSGVGSLAELLTSCIDLLYYYRTTFNRETKFLIPPPNAFEAAHPQSSVYACVINVSEERVVQEALVESHLPTYLHP